MPLLSYRKSEPKTESNLKQYNELKRIIMEYNGYKGLYIVLSKCFDFPMFSVWFQNLSIAIAKLSLTFDLGNGYCSDFRYESNGIFMLGVGFFFFRQVSTFELAIFDEIFFISFERYCCPELKFEKIFQLWSFFVKLRGFKGCHIGQFGKLTGDILRAINA